MGVRGPTPPVRGRCREATEGVGWRSYGHEVPVGRRRRNYPAYYEPDLKPAPSSAPVCALGHLPPRGKALVGNRPLTRPFGPPSPQGEGFGGELSPSSGPSGHLPPRGKALVGNRPPHPALRATFPPGGRLWWGIAPSSGPSGHLPPRGKAYRRPKAAPTKAPADGTPLKQKSDHLPKQGPLIGVGDFHLHKLSDHRRVPGEPD